MVVAEPCERTIGGGAVAEAGCMGGCAAGPEELGFCGTACGGGIDVREVVFALLMLGVADVRCSGACEVWRTSLLPRALGFATGLKTVPPFSVVQKIWLNYVKL